MGDRVNLRDGKVSLIVGGDEVVTDGGLLFKILKPSAYKSHRIFNGCSDEDVSVPEWSKTEEGKKIEEVRKGVGLGLRKAAKCIGVKASTLSRVETGHWGFIRSHEYSVFVNAIREGKVEVGDEY
jgi:DNA-binding XRE family transcriptional regulator